MGDVLTLIEKAVATVDQEKAEKMAAKLDGSRVHAGGFSGAASSDEGHGTHRSIGGNAAGNG